MWEYGGDKSRTLEVDITAHEQDRSFTFSLICGGLQNKKQQKLDSDTYSQLSMALRKLTDRAGSPAPKAFADFGSLLFDMVLPEAIQLALLKHDGPLVFSTQELSLAWELLCADGRFLSLTHPFSRKLPMQEMLFDEILDGPAEAFKEQTAAALIIANPTGDLREAAEEAEEIEAIFEQHGIPCDRLVGPADCSFLNIMAAMRRQPYRFIHLSCHAEYLEEQETSAILLADGGRITAQALQRTFKGHPLVFLNSCWSAKESGRGGQAASRRNSIGPNVVRTLNEAFCTGNRSGRAKAIIGSMWWIADTVARGLAGRFYTEVLSGHSLGHALQRARLLVSEEIDDPALWSTYVLFGDPNLRFSCGDVIPADTDGNTHKSVTAAPDAGTSRSPAFPVKDVAVGVDSGCGTKSQRADAAADHTKESVSHESAPESIDGSRPWSDDVRAAFVGAMASMTAMKWKIFSTVHLVLGLTYVDDGLISRALQRKDINPGSARRALRELFSRNRPSNDFDGDWEVSDNLGSILATARKLAREQSIPEVTEANIVEALLEHTEAGGLMLLTCLEIDLDELGADVRGLHAAGPAATTTKADEVGDTVEIPGRHSRTNDLVFPSGDLNRDRFSKDALAALDEAVLMACRSYWPDLRSPHVFLGIINRNGSRLALHITKMRLGNPDAITKAFMASVLKKPPIDEALRPPRLHREFLSENTLKLFRNADALMVSENRATISEADLLNAILLDPENFVTASLVRIGIDPNLLRLPQVNPDIGHSTSSERDPLSAPDITSASTAHDTPSPPLPEDHSPPPEIRISEAAVALIQRPSAVGPLWLVQWNEAWQQFHFIGGQRESSESFRDCMFRELEEVLQVTHDQCIVSEFPRYHLDFIACSGRTNEDARYILKVFDVTLAESTLKRICAADKNYCLSAEEIELGQIADGRLVADNVRRVWNKYRSDGSCDAT